MGTFTFSKPPSPSLAQSSVQRGYSVSVSSEQRLAAEHDQRAYTPDSAARELRGRNVYIKTTGNHVDEFNEYFEPAILEYNSRQKRKDRRKSLDYYSEVKSPEQEFVIQIGSRATNGVLRPEAYEKGIDREWAAAKAAGEDYDLKPWLRDDANQKQVLECLERIGRGLQVRFPNFHFSVITLHADEPAGTPHLHAGGFWVGEGYKQNGKAAGVQKQCSMTKALSQMGYKDICEFTTAVKQYVAEEMALDGLQWAKGHDEPKKRLPVDQFRELKRREERVKARERAADARESDLQARERAVAAGEVKLHQERQRLSDGLKMASGAIQDANAVIAECKGWQEQQRKQASMQRRQAIIAELGRELRSDGQSERGPDLTLKL